MPLNHRHVVDLDYNQPTPKYKDFKLVKVVVSNKGKDKMTGLPTKDYGVLVVNFDKFIFSDKKENDVACLKVPQIINIEGGGIVLDYFIPYSMIADNSRINEKLSVCDFVAFPGFPDWYDRKNNLPILRTGTIASDPRFDYSHEKEDMGERIAYEAFSYGGSSGSPIFAIQKGIKVGAGLDGGGYREPMLVGINAGHLDIDGSMGSHSGISYFYKSSVILELID